MGLSVWYSVADAVWGRWGWWPLFYSAPQASLLKLPRSSGGLWQTVKDCLGSRAASTVGTSAKEGPRRLLSGPDPTPRELGRV